MVRKHYPTWCAHLFFKIESKMAGRKNMQDLYSSTQCETLWRANLAGGPISPTPRRFISHTPIHVDPVGLHV